MGRKTTDNIKDDLQTKWYNYNSYIKDMPKKTNPLLISVSKQMR